MNQILQTSFQISTTDVDAQDHLKPASILSWFQHYGTLHGEQLNMGREYLIDNYHACWILARVWYRLNRPLSSGEQLTLKTWCRGNGSLILYRDFDLLRGEENVGEGTAAWVIADIENRNMLRPSSVASICGYEPPSCAKDNQLKLIRTPKFRNIVYERTVRYADLDVNMHMNNIRYADVIMDAFPLEQLQGKYVAELQLNYSQECRFGEKLEISVADIKDATYVDGCCEDGKRRFEALVKLASY